MSANSRGTDQGPQGSRHASLPADHFAEIVWRHGQFEYRGLAFDLFYRDFLGGINQRFRDLLDQRSHVYALLAHRTFQLDGNEYAAGFAGIRRPRPLEPAWRRSC